MNRFHNWYCNSGRWRGLLEDSVMPWVLRGVTLGDNVLEVGPGPGLTTDLLRQRVARLTCVELDENLATRLRRRLAGTNVSVVHADATQMPLPDGEFSGATSLTMLHHVPSPDLQDALLREVFRVLGPGGTFVGYDSTDSLRFRINHLFDVGVPVDPRTFPERLRQAGFVDVKVRPGERAFRFAASKPV